MLDKAIQDYFSGDYAQCMGCGNQNADGFQIKTYWDGRQGSYRFRPQPNQRAFPGVLYGGMIASIMDCHCIGTAIAGAYDREGRPPGSLPMIMYVTANLNVSYLKSTPMDVELLLYSEITEQTERKSIVTCRLCAEDEDQAFARGEVVAVRVA
jgi:acyl-coenzyme A thioesterase PaaI-like protein